MICPKCSNQYDVYNAKVWGGKWQCPACEIPLVEEVQHHLYVGREDTPIDPLSVGWEKIANQMARDFTPNIYPCKHCGMPVIEGYGCSFCKSTDSR